MSKTTGLWLGWLGIISAVVAFFYAPYWLGGIGAVLGLLVLTTPNKALAWGAIALGIIAILIPIFS